jgi:NTE family protein
MKTFALALGSGGARALAHIAVVEALDEMGVRPVAIAGTSLGALIGAAYAARMRGKDIRHHVIHFAHDRRETVRRLLQARAGRLTDLFSGAISQATQFDAEKFCAQFLPDVIPAEFSALAIPLTVMTTDLHRRTELPISSGSLRLALAASIAFPGLFRPVILDGRILVDGGATNPLPFDQLAGRADIIVAVDVFGAPAADRTDLPGTWESVFTTVLIMGSTIVAAKHSHAAPDLTIHPNVAIFRTLDFYRASAIIRSAELVKPEISDKLEKMLSAAL